MPRPAGENIPRTVIASVLGAGILWLFSVAWSSKEGTDDHTRDVNGLHTDIIRVEGKVDRVLDALCGPQQSAHVCKDDHPLQASVPRPQIDQPVTKP